MTWNLWLSPGAGGASRAAIGRFQGAVVNSYRRRSTPPPPPERIRQAYWTRYEADREPLRPWETLLTALSLGAYAWALIALAARPLEVDRPTRSSASSSNPAPSGKRRCKR